MAGKKDKIKDTERNSIIVPYLNKCMICGSTDRVAVHEIYFGTANRKKSKEDGMCVPLCWSHHNGSSFGVHYNKDLDLKLKKQGEKIWIDNYTDDDLPYVERIDRFIWRYGKNYLEENDYEIDT